MNLELSDLDFAKLWALDWSQLVLFALVLLGVTYLVGWSRISYPLRLATSKTAVGLRVVLLLECPKCLGFHLGWAALIFGWGPFAGAGPWRWLVQPVVASALMLIADRFDLFQHDAMRDRHAELDQAELLNRRAQSEMTLAIKEMGQSVKSSSEDHRRVVERVETELLPHQIFPSDQEKKS